MKIFVNEYSIIITNYVKFYGNISTFDDIYDE